MDAGFLVDFSLPSGNGLMLDSILHETNSSLITVGKPKKNILQKDFFSEDGFALQVNDILIIDFADIGEFLKCYHCDKDKSTLIIQYDKSVPRSLIDKLVVEASEYIRPKNIFKTVINHPKQRLELLPCN